METNGELVKKEPDGRDPATGQFVKGNKIRPNTYHGKRKDYYPILKAVAEDAYTPEQLTDLVHETVDLAREAQDWKGIYAVLKLVMDYTIGKPVQRSISASMDADELRAIFFAGEANDDDGGGGVIIDVSVEPVPRGDE